MIPVDVNHIYIYIDSVYDISSKGREGGPSKGFSVVVQQIFMKRVGAARPVVTYPQSTGQVETVACWKLTCIFWIGFGTGACCILWLLLR